jgi:hypothetical protein
MGLGKHDLYERVFGSETALRVMQQSRVPVLAVPQNWIGIPRTLLVAAAPVETHEGRFET